MCATNWQNFQSGEALHRRAGGRRRINAERKARAQKRRAEIKQIIGEGGILLCGSSYGWGKETMLADYFGIHRSTISRDIAALKAEYREEHLCRGCWTLYSTPLKTLTRMAKHGVWDGCTTQRCQTASTVAP